MFTGAGQRDIADGDHFIHLHFISRGYFSGNWYSRGRRKSVNAHLSDTMRRFHQTVIAQIEIQQLHNSVICPAISFFAFHYPVHP